MQAHISFLTYTNTKRETKETELMTEDFFDDLGEKSFTSTLSHNE